MCRKHRDKKKYIYVYVIVCFFNKWHVWCVYNKTTDVRFNKFLTTVSLSGPFYLQLSFKYLGFLRPKSRITRIIKQRREQNSVMTVSGAENNLHNGKIRSQSGSSGRKRWEGGKGKRNGWAFKSDNPSLPAPSFNLFRRLSSCSNRQDTAEAPNKRATFVLIQFFRDFYIPHLYNALITVHPVYINCSTFIIFNIL